MDEAMLTALRDRLTGEQADLHRQLGELGARSDGEGIEDPELNENFADAGQVAAERSNLLGLVEALRESLREVEDALGRMEDGSYGTCTRCGKPIAQERLEALPAVRLCIRCKQETRG